MGTGTRAGSILDRINKILLVVCIILLAFSWLSVCFEVITRYFFHKPQIWVVEFSEYILVWITFLGAAALVKGEGHTRMDLLLIRFKPKTQDIINAVTFGLCVVTWLAMTYYGVQLVWNFFEQGLVTQTILKFPRAPIYAILPIGSFLLFVEFLRRTSSYITHWRSLRKS